MIALVLALALLLLAAPAAHAAAQGPGARVSAAERRAAERALERVRRLRAGRGVRTGRELTLALRDLALRLPALPGSQRRAGEALLARPTDGPTDPQSFGYTAVEHVPPHCTTNFCVHWVDATDDAPDPADSEPDLVPDYVETMAAELEAARSVEVGTGAGQLGWRTPPLDDPPGAAPPLGGDTKTDVYLKQLGDKGLFGFAATDPGQTGSSRYSYLVMDDDYAAADYPGYADPLLPLRVTAAHEYNHVLQYGYDAFQDAWMFESTATWMEEKVHPTIDDYLTYLRPPRWASLTEVPLTFFNYEDSGDPRNAKAYGNAVWNHWLDRRYGPEVVRGAWEASLTTSPASFAPGAYQASIAARGGQGFFDELARFSAAVAEWRAAGAGFGAEGALYPNVERVGALTPDQVGAAVSMDHTTFALLDVPTPPAALKLIVELPAGTAGALALVGRAGDETGGAVTTSLLPLPAGGRGAVKVEGGFARLTAVLVNADATQTGSSPTTGDWVFAKDGQAVSARASTDFTPPAVTAVSPAPDALGVPTGGNASATFSEPVGGVSAQTFQLADPAGAAVPAAVAYDSATRTATLDPAAALKDTTRYTARLSGGVADGAENALAELAWSFTTVRVAPAVSLSGPRVQRARTVLRRGLSLTLRSRDPDAVRYALALDARSRDLRARRTRAVGRRRGSIAAGRTARLRVRLSAAARRALRAGRRVRVSVAATLTDPQRNVRRKRRRIAVR